jgi:hypothetical protein
LLLQLGSQNSQGKENRCPEQAKRAEGDGTDTLQIADPSHAQLLTGLHIHAELIRSRIERKPARSVMFETKTAWTG